MKKLSEMTLDELYALSPKRESIKDDFARLDKLCGLHGISDVNERGYFKTTMQLLDELNVLRLKLQEAAQ